MAFSFPKKERLKRQKLITKVFNKGASIRIASLKLIYVEAELPEDVPIQAGFSVSKRNFKRAVDRNRAKRLMREAYRLHKASIFNNSTTQYAFMFLYLGKKLPDLHSLNDMMKAVLDLFEKRAFLNK